MNPILNRALGASLLLSLGLMAGCSSSGTSEEGLTAQITALPLGKAHPHEDDAHAHALGEAIAKHSAPTYHRFRRADGMKIDLQLGLLNLVPVALQPCETTVSQRLGEWLAPFSPLGTAIAHAGHAGEAPEGAFDVLGIDGTGLGSLPVMPGAYCGVVLELRPVAVATAKHGGELDTSLDGFAASVSPCYYDTTVGLSDADAEAVTEHSCLNPPAKLGTQVRSFTVPFAEPVLLDAQHRTLDLRLMVRYEEWFDGVDLPTLASSSAEQNRVLDNIEGSLQALTGEQTLVNLAFDLRVDEAEVVCGATYDGLGVGTVQQARLEGLRFYASDFELEPADGAAQPVALGMPANGTVFQDDTHGVALLGQVNGCDAAEPVVKRSLTGTAPAGDYARMCFTLGVPFALNHSDVATAPSPLNNSAMSWAWLSGRIGFRLDTVANPGGTPANYFVHLGSTGCSNGGAGHGTPPTEACTQPNRPRICLDYADIAAGQPVVVDVADLLRDADIGVNTPSTAPGCMSASNDPECTAVLPRLGVGHGGVEGHQSVFRVGDAAHSH